jgi:hypothetical protein
VVPPKDGFTHFLNPISDGLIETTLIDDDSIFGAMISNATIFHGLLKNELGSFCHLHVKLEDFTYCPWLGGSPMKHGFQMFILWFDKFMGIARS